MAFFSSRGSFSRTASGAPARAPPASSRADGLLLDQELLHLGVEPALFEHGLGFLERRARLPVGDGQPVGVLQVGVRLGDLGVAGLVAKDLGVGQFLGEEPVLVFYLRCQSFDHAWAVPTQALLRAAARARPRPCA